MNPLHNAHVVSFYWSLFNRPDVIDNTLKSWIAMNLWWSERKQGEPV